MAQRRQQLRAQASSAERAVQLLSNSGVSTARTKDSAIQCREHAVQVGLPKSAFAVEATALRVSLCGRAKAGGSAAGEVLAPWDPGEA